MASKASPPILLSTTHRRSVLAVILRPAGTGRRPPAARRTSHSRRSGDTGLTNCWPGTFRWWTRSTPRSPGSARSWAGRGYVAPTNADNCCMLCRFIGGCRIRWILGWSRPARSSIGHGTGTTGAGACSVYSDDDLYSQRSGWCRAVFEHRTWWIGVFRFGNPRNRVCRARGRWPERHCRSGLRWEALRLRVCRSIHTCVRSIAFAW